MATDLISPLLEDVLFLAKASLYPVPSRVVVVPGLDAVWDECCEGQLWVRLVSYNPVQPTTVRSGDPACNVQMWDAGIAVGILRCVSVVDDQGRAPSPAQMLEDARMIHRDMADLQEVLQCSIHTVDNVLKARMGSWNSLGPEGGCAGGEWAMTLTLPNCACP